MRSGVEVQEGAVHQGRDETTTCARRVPVAVGVECELRSMHVRGLLSLPPPPLASTQPPLLMCCPVELTGDQWS